MTAAPDKFLAGSSRSLPLRGFPLLCLGVTWFLGGGFLTSPALAYAPAYTLKQVISQDTLPYHPPLNSIAIQGLSNQGLLVGYYTLSSSVSGNTAGHTYAFVTDTTKTANNQFYIYMDLGYNSAQGAYVDSLATCVNEQGQVAGVVWPTSGPAQQGFVWKANTAPVFFRSPENGSIDGVLAINYQGQVIGTYFITGSRYKHAFFWDGTSNPSVDLGDLQTLTKAEFSPTALNDAGQVSGTIRYYTNETASPQLAGSNAFLWQGNTLFRLQDQGSFSSGQGLSMNAWGEVVGTCTVPGQNGGAATAIGFDWLGSGVVDIGSLGGGNVSPVHVDDQGYVIGTGKAADQSRHLFSWQLGDSAPADKGLARLSSADIGCVFTSINRYGDGVGYVFNSSLQQTPFVRNGRSGALTNVQNAITGNSLSYQPSVSQVLRLLINDRSYVALSGVDSQGKPVILLLTADNSNDGLPDGWESSYGLGTNVNANAEAAGSGLTYLEKYQYDLNPLVASTAGDAFTDGWKVRHLLNPHHRMVADTNNATLKLQVYTVLQPN